MKQPQGTTAKFATFRIADLLLGIEVLTVQEIIRYQEMTRIPLAPSVVEGVINLRGQIVVAIDTRQSLGLPPAPRDSTPVNIVVQSEGDIVSLLADDVGDVLDVPMDSYGPVPENMPQTQKDLIKGVYQHGERLLLALDTARLLENASC